MLPAQPIGQDASVLLLLSGNASLAILGQARVYSGFIPNVLGVLAMEPSRELKVEQLFDGALFSLASSDQFGDLSDAIMGLDGALNLSKVVAVVGMR